MARWADGFEQAGPRLWPGFAGLVLMEAVKQTYAVKPKGSRARVRAVRPVLAPTPGAAPASRAPVSRAPVSRAPGPAGLRSLLERPGESLSLNVKSAVGGAAGDAPP